MQAKFDYLDILLICTTFFRNTHRRSACRVIFSADDNLNKFVLIFHRKQVLAFYANCQKLFSGGVGCVCVCVRGWGVGGGTRKTIVNLSSVEIHVHVIWWSSAIKTIRKIRKIYNYGQNRDAYSITHSLTCLVNQSNSKISQILFTFQSHKFCKSIDKSLQYANSECTDKLAFLRSLIRDFSICRNLLRYSVSWTRRDLVQAHHENIPVYIILNPLNPTFIW